MSLDRQYQAAMARRGKTVSPGQGRPQKPGCPRHQSEMRYDPDRMVWACTDPSCAMIALPKEEVDAGKGKPRIGEGLLELVKQVTPNGTRQGKERWLLRAPDNNILIDVTPYIARVEAEMDGRGSPTIEVTLRLNNITEIRGT